MGGGTKETISRAAVEADSAGLSGEPVGSSCGYDQQSKACDHGGKRGGGGAEETPPSLVHPRMMLPAQSPRTSPLRCSPRASWKAQGRRRASSKQAGETPQWGREEQCFGGWGGGALLVKVPPNSDTIALGSVSRVSACCMDVYGQQTFMPAWMRAGRRSLSQRVARLGRAFSAPGY